MKLARMNGDSNKFWLKISAIMPNFSKVLLFTLSSYQCFSNFALTMWSPFLEAYAMPLLQLSKNLTMMR